MNRSDYLATPDVQRFVAWLSRHLDSATLLHQYTHRQTGKGWQFQGISDAWRQYQWSHPAISRLNVAKGNTVDSNAKALAALQADLRVALEQMNDDAACKAAIDVMIWGGVQAHNVAWLLEHREGLAATLVATRDAIDQGQLNAELLLNKALRFNAGMTKVYSLICRDFIIYDSRVAAALGWLVVRYCSENGLSTLPATLAFPWASAKEGKTATPKNRNPGQGSLTFPRLQAGTLHAQWNMRASWLLHAVLAHGEVASEAFKGQSGLRNLEAALFMLGYDLGGQHDDHRAVEADSPVAEADWIAAVTETKKSPFRYRITADEIVIDGKPVFPLLVINQTLTWLQQKFGSSPFPLANSADGVRADNSPDGIGVAYFNATAQRGNVPDSSKLAAVLKGLGVLSRDGKHWTLNHDLLEVDAHGQIDVGPVLAALVDNGSAV